MPWGEYPHKGGSSSHGRLVTYKGHNQISKFIIYSEHQPGFLLPEEGVTNTEREKLKGTLQCYTILENFCVFRTDYLICRALGKMEMEGSLFKIKNFKKNKN